MAWILIYRSWVQTPADTKLFLISNEIKSSILTPRQRSCAMAASGGIMIEGFLWWVAEKSLFVCLYVCLCVCLSKHFGTWSPNGWADRDGRGFVRRARTAERRWCQSWGDRNHVAHAKCRCVNPYKKIRQSFRLNQWTDSAQTFWADRH